MDRFYGIKGAKNTRDFYGLASKDGKRIVSHDFVRSCTLDKLGRKDRAKLGHIGLVIDLRDADEAKEKPDKVDSFAVYKNMPVFGKTTVGVSMSSKSISMLDNLPDMCDIYRNMVTDADAVENIKNIIQEILSSDVPVLWHCSEGKDRCGVISALFLSLLDVPEETIMEDYLATNLVASKNKTRYYKLVLFATRDKRKADAILPFFEAREEFLLAALDGINATYGSVDNFLSTALCVTPSQKATLKAKCLE